MEDMDKNEFEEIADKDLQAISGGCNTSPDGYRCNYCTQYFSGKANHRVNYRGSSTGSYPVCDSCYEEKKNNGMNWS